MKNFLYFAEADVNTGGAETAREGIMIPASKYIGADPVGPTQTRFVFESVEGLDEGHCDVLLTHGSGNNKKVIRAFMAAMNTQHSHGGLVVMVDSDVAGSSKVAEYSPAFNGDVTAIVITEPKTSAKRAATHGAGAIGTAGAPATRRWIENNVIVTQIMIDLTGLTAHGATANDVIGLKAGAPNAYLIQNTAAQNGIIFKTEITCLETPAGAGSLDDINFVWNASGTLGYTEAGGTAYGFDGSSTAFVKGETVAGVQTAAPTADHYLYMTEGTTDGDDSVFTAGQFVITFYGYLGLSL